MVDRFTVHAELEALEARRLELDQHGQEYRRLGGRMRSLRYDQQWQEKMDGWTRILKNRLPAGQADSL